jgi:hypothetical protein
VPWISRDRVEFKTHLLGKDLAILLNIPRDPVDADGFQNLSIRRQHSHKHNIIRYNNQKFSRVQLKLHPEMLLPLCTSANVTQKESIMIYIEPTSSLLTTLKLLL